ncbi:hypothetical protein DdX_01420 [Ditylenchus destructor]|uniref:Secreted protein n=1 Tax=Ditylenchus destructor TaxID=166010 RepID=A0AAD4NIS5_9BILA|nr:hypothetical protein DdX_01420 [Ditylenchus destructor]
MLLLRSTLCILKLGIPTHEVSTAGKKHPKRTRTKGGEALLVCALNEAVALCNIDCQQCEENGGSTPAVTYFPSHVQGPKQRGNR